VIAPVLPLVIAAIVMGISGLAVPGLIYLLLVGNAVFLLAAGTRSGCLSWYAPDYLAAPTGSAGRDHAARPGTALRKGQESV
jgi:hypothetical protein